ncbi:UrvD/REP family ATP-dependent DNA helicase [Chryseoglobus sp. 28M-23]|uniref:UrvD/REP family ATP-dependent DNA helicase n=1 Tax=Chryseoglobus sp. 28M-23 TaxID=2772253 RepID=UPI001746E73F|nr:UrvD/REP family ATP-dependent DNA helicase [Chryseoglobus sp. 28M-23]QOD94350.1 ATP-dependent helicase [Chryseoglobus sp. 28M-23]
MTALDAAPPAQLAHPVSLDASQEAVLDARRGPGAVVLGAPGTGKTATVVELVSRAIEVDGLDPQRVLVLTPSRRSATALRDRLALRLAGPASVLPGPLARSIASYAFGVVQADARLTGTPEPRLLSGADQDSDIAELLDRSALEAVLGEVASPGPAWPEHLGPEVRQLTAFRTELRDVLARLSEHGWSTDDLRAAAARLDRPEWAAVADFADEYRDSLGGARLGQQDPAELVRAAVGLLADPHPAAPEAPSLVILDDAHDATPSGFDLLAALAARGATVIALGDPDVATNTFRGAEPESLTRLAGLPTLVLETAHRQSPTLRALTAQLTSRIGAAAAGAQRRARPGHSVGPSGDEHSGAEAEAPELGGPLLALTASSPARERTLIADVLRERHLIDGVPWSRMAVIVRSGALVPPLVRALALAEVPVRSTAPGRPLREHPAARALIRHVDLGVGRAPLTAEAATELLLGPLGGLDRVDLRRLRRALRAEELAGDGARTADELLVDALSAPDRLATIDHRVARRAARLARTLARIAERHAEGATVDELLWIAWDDARVVERWQRDAVAGGTTGGEADRALDAVVAVFTTATVIVDTVPEATVETFLTRVLDSDVADDLLAPARTTEAVLVTSPSAAAGLEVDVVVVANVLDGVWPDLRLRGSLLHAPLLSRVARGLPTGDLDERRLVLEDELRMFSLAISRARRQVVVTASAGEDEQPSALHEIVAERERALREGDTGRSGTAGAAPPRREGAPYAAPPHRVIRARSLRRTVGQLRRVLTDPRESHDRRAEAATALARLAAERVPGADPDEWWGLLDVSTEAPLFVEEETVGLSPSKIESIERSPLDWFLDTIAPGESTPAMGIGTIVHWALESLSAEVLDPAAPPAVGVEEVWAAIEARWSELSFESPWLAEQQRRLARRYAVGLADYLRDAAGDGRAAVAAEQRFTVQVDRVQVRGIVDRMEVGADGALRIIDLKTGRPETNAAKVAANAQLGAYQLAFADGAFDDALEEALRPLRDRGALDPAAPVTAGGAVLLYVREGKGDQSYREAVQAVLDDEALEAFRERLRLALAAITVDQLAGPRTVGRYDYGSLAHRVHRVPPVTGDDS